MRAPTQRGRAGDHVGQVARCPSPSWRARRRRREGRRRARLRHRVLLGLAGEARRARRRRRPDTGAARDGAADAARRRARVRARGGDRRGRAAARRVVRHRTLRVRRGDLVPTRTAGFPRRRAASARRRARLPRNSTLLMLCATGRRSASSSTLQRPTSACTGSSGASDDGVEFQLASRRVDAPAPRERLRAVEARRDPAPRSGDAGYYDVRARRLGAAVAVRGDLGSAQERERPPPPLLLASTSPQRRAILEQLGIPFDVVAPDYEEQSRRRPGLEHAAGKARSVDGGGGPCSASTRPSSLRRRACSASPRTRATRSGCSRQLSGRQHAVVSGLCLRTPAWEETCTETTLVTFRELTPRDLAWYVSSGEWEGRAGAYAIQGRGAASRRARRRRLPQRRRAAGVRARRAAGGEVPGALRLWLVCASHFGVWRSLVARSVRVAAASLAMPLQRQRGFAAFPLTLYRALSGCGAAW